MDLGLRPRLISDGDSESIGIRREPDNVVEDVASFDELAVDDGLMVVGFLRPNSEDDAAVNNWPKRLGE